MAESTLIMSRQVHQLDGSLKQKAYSFLEKLTTDDSLPGLHIEPIKNSADPRVRTGRVDQQYRAVLFRLGGAEKPNYVFHGIYNHDEAIDIAARATLDRNPINGIVEIRVVEPEPSSPEVEVSVSVDDDLSADTSAGDQEKTPPQNTSPEPEVAPLITCTFDELTEELGMSADVASRALRFTDPDLLLTYADTLVDWQGMALVDLASEMSVAQVRDNLDMQTPESSGPSSDEELLQSLQKPSSQAQFAMIEGVDELRRVIESGDFMAWRVFLHPKQRKWATGRWKGPFRLTGGAGTGKTVVVLHRARQLARRNPTARIVVTTFTVNLAHALDEDLQRLDPTLPRATRLGDPGIYVAGIDSIAFSVLKDAGAAVGDAAAAVLGSPRTDVFGRDDRAQRWHAAMDGAGSDLRAELRSPAFFASEYQLVVLANEITQLDDYLRVRRPGRGVRLSRPDRAAVWKVIEAYRAAGRSEGKLSYAEAASMAAECLGQRGQGSHAARGDDDEFTADHVLVDEGQDLSPSHWKLIRALVDNGPDDMFIAEDSHQRIYGHRLVLSRFGIETRGRSRRLTLNYRTTAENLAWAVSVLEGATYVDLDDEAESTTGYRSARRGPKPVLKSCGSLREEFDVASNTVRSWLGEPGVSPETIAVLVRDRTQRDSVVAALHERGVSVRSVDRESVRPGKPVVMTMHRAKGMEFTKVLLFEVSARSIPMGMEQYDYDESEKAEALLRERSLLYVAASRARDELMVTWRGSASDLIGAAVN